MNKQEIEGVLNNPLATDTQRKQAESLLAALTPEKPKTTNTVTLKSGDRQVTVSRKYFEWLKQFFVDYETTDRRDDLAGVGLLMLEFARDGYKHDPDRILREQQHNFPLFDFAADKEGA